MDHSGEENEAETFHELTYKSPKSMEPQNDNLMTPARLGCLFWVAAFICGVLAGTHTPYVEIPAVFLAVAFVIAGFWFMYFGNRKQKRSSQTREEEFEEEWESRNMRRNKVVREAVETFKNGPIGKWRFVELEMRGRNMTPLVHQERIVIFDQNGTGDYVWSRGLGGVSVATSRFEFRVQEKLMQVRLIYPQQSEWTQVEWGFQGNLLSDGDVNLWIWFESENPLREDTADCWPFWGELRQMPMP